MKSYLLTLLEGLGFESHKLLEDLGGKLLSGKTGEQEKRLLSQFCRYWASPEEVEAIRAVIAARFEHSPMWEGTDRKLKQDLQEKATSYAWSVAARRAGREIPLLDHPEVLKAFGRLLLALDKLEYERFPRRRPDGHLAT